MNAKKVRAKFIELRDKFMQYEGVLGVGLGGRRRGKTHRRACGYRAGGKKAAEEPGTQRRACGSVLPGSTH